MADDPFDVALDAWRITRSPRFAAIVDAISAKEPERELVGASGKKVDVAKWFALADAGDWRDLPRLVATITAGNSPQALERVNKLRERDDPRLVRGLLAIVEEAPYTAGTSRKFWQAVIAALEASNDVRARDGMLDLSRRYKTINDTNMGAWIGGALSKAAAKIGEPKPLDAEQAAALEALELAILGEAGATLPRKAPKPAISPEEMFANIVEAPDDDDARLVYADVLAELGQSERAELIVLQVERAAGRGTPERADLERTKFEVTNRLKEYGVPISAAAHRIYFDRGFPYRVELANIGLAHVFDAIEWGTVRVLERVDQAPVTAVQKLLDGGRAKNLLRVEGLSARVLDKVKTPAFPWTHVRLADERPRPAHVARFPKLTHLAFKHRAVVEPELFAAAPELVSVTFEQGAGADAALFAKNPKLRRLAAGPDAEPERFAGLAVRELTIHGRAADADPWLRALPTVRELVFIPIEADLVAVADLFDRHPSLEKASCRFGYFERSGASLTLVAVPARRWVHHDEQLAAAGARLAGRARLVLYPEQPRHVAPPAPVPELVRSAWPDLEVRELL